MFLRVGSALAVLLLTLALTPVSARAEIRPEHQRLVDEVAKKLLAVAPPVDGWAWPPIIQIEDSPDINAYAYLEVSEDENVKPQPHIRILTGALDHLIQGSADRLAYLLGHELAHITRKHVGNTERGGTDLLFIAVTREQELEADLDGLAFALEAGYDPDRALGCIKRFMEMGFDYTRFEGLHADHPSWKDRLAHIDENQAQLWQSMSAFYNGNLLLHLEQYAAAERCFDQVTKAFPACAEAWANLGYARLMQYCDALEPENLRNFDIGQLVVGGFYRRPASLEAQIRGIDSDLWWDAVGALREALRLDRNSVVAAGNLGVAYLVAPEGKDVGKSTQYFEMVLEMTSKLASDDPHRDPLMEVALLTNAGVAQISAGNNDSAARHFASARQQLQSLANQGGEVQLAAPILWAALLYNSASMLAASDSAEEQNSGIETWEQYLRVNSPASAWWSIGYERYAALCKKLELEPKSVEELSRGAGLGLRMITAVELPDLGTVAISDSSDALHSQLGEAVETTVVRGTSLRRMMYQDRGIEFVVNDKEVIAIVLNAATSPRLKLRDRGVATESSELYIGMTVEELDALLSELPVYRNLIDPNVKHRFYRSIGLAVRVEDGKVVELVLVQVPDRQLPI